jgi:hypothetical protein
MIWPIRSGVIRGTTEPITQCESVGEFGQGAHTSARASPDADASFQQQLDDQVERLMSSRGVPHEWGDDLVPLKALRFEVEGSR